MSVYEEGFESLSRGEYRRAADLLGQAARETAFASDMVNHAYTLALFRSGERALLADVAFRIGNSLVSTDPASAMDYFQRAIQAGLDPARARLIGEIHDGWAGEKTTVQLHGNITRVAHVVTALIPGQPRTRYMDLLTHMLFSRGIESIVFTSEADAAWFVNPAQNPLTERGILKVPVTVGSVEGDFLQRAERLAEAIQDSATQLVLYHTNLSDQIATRTSAMHPAPVQIAVNHGAVMEAELFNGTIHLAKNALERSRRAPGISEWIPPSSDIEVRLNAETLEGRESIGVDAGATVSVSFAGPLRSQLDFARALIEIMRRFPSHFHLFAGNGDVRAVRGLFHSEGVLSRMRFLGLVSDVTRLLRAIDLCLVPFPEAGCDSVMDLIAAGKPVLALQYPLNSEFNAAGELIGEGELTPRTAAGYIQTADRLIRDKAYRFRMGERLRDRFQKEFTPERLIERYLRFFDQLR